MTMTAKQLVDIAEAAFGRQWKTPLREALKTVKETYTCEMLWRYATSQNDVPPELAAKIARICLKEIDKHIARLPTIKAKAEGVLAKLQAAA